ncbi:MAG: cytochrome c maturation protein CcmE [ANME-2 cluster archaeon]|nr:cytochrome c maturation protein CcmE [ANME-2 cluster archaeon]
MNRKNKTIMAAIVFMVLIGYLTITGLGNSVSSYVKIAEVKNGNYEGQFISINGSVVNNTVSWDPDKTELTFKMSDDTGTFDVYYKGNLPNSFNSEFPIVVQGQYVNEVFNARNILVKCPSKYKAEIEE